MGPQYHVSTRQGIKTCFWIRAVALEKQS
jgi:hypothetical protein